MKKYFYLLLAIVLFTPMIVFADSSGPRVLGYDAVIINPKGAKVYESDSKDVIPYNTKIHVYDEIGNFDGIASRYAVVCYINDKDCNRWDGNSKNILLTDIAPLKEEISSKDIKDIFGNNDYNDEVFFSVSNDKFIVFEKDGINLSKGPSDIYGKYDKKIDYMTFLKTSYVLTSGGGEDNPIIYWYYIDDGVNKGWLKQTSDYSGYNMGKSNEKKLVFTDTKISDENGNLVLTIPSETLLNDIYYIGKEKRYFIKYNGKEGYTKNDNYGEIVPGLILTVRDTKIISMDGKVRGEIPLGKVLKNVYGFYESFDRGPDILCGVSGLNNKEYYYVEYNKIKGFVIADSVHSFITHNDESEKLLEKEIDKKEMTFEQDVDMREFKSDCDGYEQIEDYKIIDKITKGTKIISLYSNTSVDYDNKKDYTYYLVNYNGIPGWVIIESQSNNNEGQQNEEDKPVNIVPENKKNSKSNDTLYYAIGGAVLVSVVAVITVILVNKNKKKEKEQSVDKKNIKEEKVTIDNEQKKKHNVLEESKDIEEKEIEKKD